MGGGGVEALVDASIARPSQSFTWGSIVETRPWSCCPHVAISSSSERPLLTYPLVHVSIPQAGVWYGLDGHMVQDLHLPPALPHHLRCTAALVLRSQGGQPGPGGWRSSLLDFPFGLVSNRTSHPGAQLTQPNDVRTHRGSE